MTDVVLVAAVADDGTIGDSGGMPWHVPEDLARFRSLTMGAPVLMGRRTHESILEANGGPLKGRDTIVLSHTMGGSPYPEVLVRRSISDGLRTATGMARDGRVVVAGGAGVYRQFLRRGLVDRMQLTEIHMNPGGDTAFPDWDRTAWAEVDSEAHAGFRFVTYE